MIVYNEIRKVLPAEKGGAVMMHKKKFYDVLRARVSEYRRNGFPDTIPEEDFLSIASSEQQELYKALKKIVEEDTRLRSRPVDPDSEIDLRHLWRKGYARFQEAIVLGLDTLLFVQRNASIFGAIPTSRWSWQYCELPGGGYVCWDCFAFTNDPTRLCQRCKSDEASGGRA